MYWMLYADFVINTYKVLILESDLFLPSQYIMESYNYKDNKNNFVTVTFTLLSVEIYHFQK